VLREVVELHLERLRKRAAELRVDLSWEPSVLEICTAGRNDTTLGARPSLRAIDERVAGPLGRWLLENVDLGSGWREVRAVVRAGEVQLETGAVRSGQVRGGQTEPTHS